MENQKTIILGTEYDEQLINDLNRLLINEGAAFTNGIEGVAGSQDYKSYDIRFKNSIIKVEIETYIGLLITGDESIVDYISATFKNR
ncbi:hypothetical protein F0919_14540 [Taibaiella lutea]|uniref:DUF3630 family protein n=1 Tax=Taibaiella lutea TaxID=2608001 RepID=A0A5M6CFC6_9BACT|nr:hypothetical protein [Taibaiella lutea]KAA5533747.1 hypothetical protein F0919_14540 [Taibaiella lutea]